MAQSSQPSLSLEETKGAMQDVLNAFEVAENKTRMEEVKDAAGNDMMKMMQIVFPVVTQIQQEVIAKYGFTTDGEGAIKFAQTVRQYEVVDNDIASMASKLKSLFLPPMPPILPTKTETTVVSSS